MISRIRVSDGADLHLRLDDFTDGWTSPTTVLCVHGFGESGEAWRAYVPHLSRLRRVARIDMRGFGESTPMPRDYHWSLDRWTQDFIESIEAIDRRGVHVVASKVAGLVSVATAVLRPDLVRSLTLIGAVVRGPDHSDSIDLIEQRGLRAFVERDMALRLGADAPQSAVSWWTDLMCRTPVSTVAGFFRFIPAVDVRDRLPQLMCPTQVIATDSARRPIASTTEWQQLIPASRLVPVSGDAYHVAAVEPDRCAALVSTFLDEVEAR
jgi:3-oxoadipate enol-lactonase